MFRKALIEYLLPYRAVFTAARCKKYGFVFHADKRHKPNRVLAAKETG